MSRVTALVRRRPRGRQPRRVARLRAAFRAVEEALVTRAARGARGLVQSLSMYHSLGRGTEPFVTSLEGDRIRVLRWTFARGGDRVICELALSSDHSVYELKTDFGPQSVNVERFSDAVAAFDRQSAFERSLLTDGWSLECYESAVVERQRGDDTARRSGTAGS